MNLKAKEVDVAELLVSQVVDQLFKNGESQLLAGIGLMRTKFAK